MFFIGEHNRDSYDLDHLKRIAAEKLAEYRGIETLVAELKKYDLNKNRNDILKSLDLKIGSTVIIRYTDENRQGVLVNTVGDVDDGCVVIRRKRKGNKTWCKENIDVEPKYIEAAEFDISDLPDDVILQIDIAKKAPSNRAFK